MGGGLGWWVGGPVFDVLAGRRHIHLMLRPTPEEVYVVVNGSTQDG